MKISAGNIELIFNEYLDYKTKERTGEWSAKLPSFDEGVSFEFDEKIFKDYKTGSITIDWDELQKIINRVLSDYKSLDKKSQQLLLALNQAIFDKKKIYPKRGYFEFVGFELESVQRGNYEIKLAYFFTMPDGFPIDPYFSWSVSFSNAYGSETHTAIGVERREH